MADRSFPAPTEGLPSTGAKGFIDSAVDAVAEADGRCRSCRTSLPTEVRDVELRAALTEVRELLGGVRRRARDVERRSGVDRTAWADRFQRVLPARVLLHGEHAPVADIHAWTNMFERRPLPRPRPCTFTSAITRPAASVEVLEVGRRPSKVLSQSST